MGMFDIFTSGTNAVPAPVAPAPGAPPIAAPGSIPPAPGTPVEPGNLPSTAGAVDPANPHVPPGTVEPAIAASQVPDSPLAPFEKLWEDVPVDPNSPTPSVPQVLKAEDVQKAVANANFAGAVTAEQMTAISAGGEDAVKAMQAMMNGVAQQVMVQATLVGNKLTDKAVATALEQQKKEIPAMLREQATTAHLSDTNPIFNNPAIKPVIDSTKAQLLQKFPEATPAEITQMTQDYILAMGEAFAPKAPDLAPGEQDWDKFLEGG